MGIIYNNYNNNSISTAKNKYIKSESWRKEISHQRQVRALTRQNIQFLKSLGLRVVSSVGKSRV